MIAAEEPTIASEPSTEPSTESRAESRAEAPKKAKKRPSKPKAAGDDAPGATVSHVDERDEAEPGALAEVARVDEAELDGDAGDAPDERGDAGGDAAKEERRKPSGKKKQPRAPTAEAAGSPMGKRAKADESKTKRINSYMLFCAENRASVQSKKDAFRELGALWNALTDEQREAYKARAMELNAATDGAAGGEVEQSA